MVAPTMVKTGEKLFVMQLNMSSPYFLERSEVIDDKTKKLFYKFPSDKRKQIQAIRQSVNVQRDAGSARFYGLYIVNELGKKQLESALTKADHEMKQVDITLKAEGMFMELSSTALSEGNMFDAMVGQIKNQILEVALKRIEDTIKRNEGSAQGLPLKTKNALIRMLEKTKMINVIRDESIDGRIEEMKAKILSEDITSLRDEILDVLNETKDRFSSLPIEDMVVDTPDVAVQEKDLPGGDGTTSDDEPETVYISPESHLTNSKAARRINIEDL
ncbi:MAG TPA: hypothetical protein DSN98_08510 [Thermoplasmata archaeon]|jgi:hypothetical protein|nr:MAG TPA: hypothetical protein DSN98_08510 [Thermoplasmata archaeon]